MAEKLVIALLSGAVGLLIGLFGPPAFQPAQQVQQAEQAWLNPDTPVPLPSPGVLVLPRAAVAQTAVPPPTLQPPPAPTPEPTPLVHTFVIALQGGGEMRVTASDEAAARNNVKSSGAEPAD